MVIVNGCNLLTKTGPKTDPFGAVWSVSVLFAKVIYKIQQQTTKQKFSMACVTESVNTWNLKFYNIFYYEKKFLILELTALRKHQG